MRVIKLMFEQSHFVNITHLFYNGDYSEGLKEISQIMRTETNNSNLYVNRALFHSQLGNDEEAIRDIEKAIKINPRNYIAYFNLFSILTKLIEDEDALAALCCSLSCLYLIRGKLTKSLQDVDKSIGYCLNNTEAHVLKGLLLMQKEKYEESMKSFQNALNIDPNNQIIKNLERIAAEKGHITQMILPDQRNEGVDQRLRSNFKLVDGVDPFDLIQQKLAQFNQLYVDINDNAGAITQKVPKDSILSPQDPPSRSRHQQIKIIYDSGLSTPKRQSEIHPQPGAIYIKPSILHEENKKQSHRYMEDDVFQEENFISIINHEQKKEQEECLLEAQVKNGSEIQQEFSSVLNIDHPFQELHEPFQSVLCEPRNTDLIPLQLQSGQAFQQSRPTQHYNLIYPVDDHMKLKITILSLQFIGKDQEYLSKLTDIYCILNYNGGQSKLKTICKGIQGEFCTWNQQFEPIDISSQPSDMKIKVYNKKYTSFRDDFLGDLQVLITTADLLKLPLYNKSGILGNLLMHLQLLQITPASIPDLEPENQEECV